MPRMRVGQAPWASQPHEIFDRNNVSTGHVPALSNGWYSQNKSKWTSKISREEMKKLRSSLGQEYSIPKSDYDYYYKNKGFTEQSSYEFFGNSDIEKYIDKAFEDGAQGLNFIIGCGHIKMMEYNEPYNALRVQFWNDAIVVYLYVPLNVYQELKSLAESKSTIWDDKRHTYRHLLGVRFWDLIRTRGSVHGSHYPFQYAEYGSPGTPRRDMYGPKGINRGRIYFHNPHGEDSSDLYMDYDRGYMQPTEAREEAARRDLIDMGFTDGRFVPTNNNYAKLGNYFDPMKEMLSKNKKAVYDSLGSWKDKYELLVREGVIGDVINGKYNVPYMLTKMATPSMSRDELDKIVEQNTKEYGGRDRFKLTGKLLVDGDNAEFNARKTHTVQPYQYITEAYEVYNKDGSSKGGRLRVKPADWQNYLNARYGSAHMDKIQRNRAIRDDLRLQQLGVNKFYDKYGYLPSSLFQGNAHNGHKEFMTDFLTSLDEFKGWDRILKKEMELTNKEKQELSTPAMSRLLKEWKVPIGTGYRTPRDSPEHAAFEMMRFLKLARQVPRLDIDTVANIYDMARSYDTYKSAHKALMTKYETEISKFDNSMRASYAKLADTVSKPRFEERDFYDHPWRNPRYNTSLWSLADLDKPVLDKRMVNDFTTNKKVQRGMVYKTPISYLDDKVRKEKEASRAWDLILRILQSKNPTSQLTGMTANDMMNHKQITDVLGHQVKSIRNVDDTI